MMRRAQFLAIAVLVSATSCTRPDTNDGGPERASFLTLIGTDTLAAEWIEFGEGHVAAQALIRGSSTTWNVYRLAFDGEGRVTQYSALTYAGGSDAGQLIRSEELVAEGGGSVMVSRQGAEESRRDFQGAPGSVPFVDMLHWPFEAAMRWQIANGGLQEAVTTFSGRGARFVLESTGEGVLHLVHPTRGPSTVRIDEEGRILRLDGTGSTRAYDLVRLGWNDLDPTQLGSLFSDRPLGELSGRGQVDDVVAGAHFTGDYGTPQKRGRQIFGSLLAYDVWWRTGANNATNFEFDREIVVDGVTVPAGRYSLSSIPGEAGGTLIINKRSDQGGQSYDEAEDQARVQLRRDRMEEIVEGFEIRVVPFEDGGRIELRWDDTVYWVPFIVRP